MRKKRILRKGVPFVLSAVVAASIVPSGAVTAFAAEGITSWVDLYTGMGVSATTDEGYYDAVTSATNFSSRHAKDIPAIVNRATSAEGATTALDGVNLTGKEPSVEVKLASASHSVYGPNTAAGKKYGSEEFILYPDDTTEGYVWNEYLANVYAVTISNGDTTVGALPWVDFYGEAATEGFHYNKLEIALNNGTSEAANAATVKRYEAFYDGDNLKSGVYTVTVYSEGYTPLTAKISTGKIAVADVTTDATAIEVSGTDTLGFTPNYQLDGVDVECKDEKISVSDLAVGSHTLTAIDAAGETSSVSTTFTASTTKVMAAYDNTSKSLVAADDVTADEFSAYLSAISKVTVNGTSYNTTGRGAVTVIGTDGSIDLSKTVAADSTENVDISVEATGYPDLTFTMAQEKGYYVLMNIPYDKFYAAEGVKDVDTVASATVKTYNQNMAGGSYHNGSLNVTTPDTDDPLDNAEILGVTYPVYVEDLSVLEGCTEVTDASKATITVASGKSARTTKDVEGKDVLFANGDYAYYKLSDEPANYKTLTVNGDTFSFSSVKNQAVADEIDSAEITYGGHYTPVNLTVSDDKITDESVVSAIIITSGNSKYALRHVENIWRKTSLGWYWTDLDEAGLAGQNISNITYYLQDGGVYSYDVDLTVKKNAGAEITATFSGEKTINVAGLPDDITNPKATVQTQVDHHDHNAKPVVIAENADINDGVITTDAAKCETTYIVTVVSDNYADINTEAIFADKHTWNDGEVTTAATCTKAGVKTYTCDVCGDTKTEEITATGKHSWNGGVVTKEPTYTEEGAKTYTCNKCGEKRTETVPKLNPKHTFKDVPNSGDTAQFYNEITWMADEGYSTGWDDGTFRPWNTINRAAVVTFLWRMNGSQEPKEMATFSDMTGNADFDKAISWAAERGITTGYSDNTFRPWEPCNRAAIVTFIWRAEGKSTGFTSKFSDKTGNSDFDTAIAWASATGITNGFKDGTFKPWDTCKRAAVAAFLYRTK